MDSRYTYACPGMLQGQQQIRAWQGALLSFWRTAGRQQNCTAGVKERQQYAPHVMALGGAQWLYSIFVLDYRRQVAKVYTVFKMPAHLEALFIELLQMPSCERLYMNAAGMLEEVICHLWLCTEHLCPKKLLTAAAITVLVWQKVWRVVLLTQALPFYVI